MEQKIDHVNHVCFLFKLENLERAIEQFTKALGIDDWDGPRSVPQFGVHHAQSLNSGIELLAPSTTEESMFTAHLREHGEGFFALTYGVADLGAAIERARANGIGMVEIGKEQPLVIDSLDPAVGEAPYPEWKSRLKRYQHVPLLPLMGLNINIGQIEPI